MPPPPIEDPPEVNELYPDFDYNLLQEPPLEWELYDVPDKTHLRNRGFHLDTFKELVKHHTWGINVVIGKRKTKERLLQVLKTIIYNHQPNLRPTWHEFVSRNCDAGPRLLRRSYNALQISRNYPRGIPGGQLLLQPSPVAEYPFIRSSNGTSGKHGPAGLTATIAPQAQHANITGPMPRFDQDYQSTVAQSTVAQATSPGYDRQLIGGRSSRYNPNLPDTQRVVHPVAFPSGLRPEPQNSPPLSLAQALNTCALPQANIHEPRELSEVIKNAIRQYTYRSLQRHPRFLTHPSIGVPFTRQSITGDIRAFSTVSHIQASISPDLTVFNFDERGALYPYRTRGPISTNKISDAVDCVIVAGIMADAGLTREDQGNDNNPSRNLSVLERAYLDAVNANWDITSDQCNAARRNFRRSLVAHINNQSNQLAVFAASPVKVWNLCTASFAQFQIQYTESRQQCNCLEMATRHTSKVSTSIKPEFQDGDAGGADMEALLNRFFRRYRPSNCFQCGVFNPNGIERLFKAIPLRLAVQADLRTYIRNHTGYIEVRFCNQEGREEKAVYRWIGGIYHTKIDFTPHFRVCWSDNERHDPNNRLLRFYDASQLSGIVIGGIPAPRDGERVPDTWWPEHRSPFVFYERVLNPDQETLNASRDAVVNMSNTARSGNSVPWGIQGHGAGPTDQSIHNGQPSSSNTTFNPDFRPPSNPHTSDADGGQAMQHTQTVDHNSEIDSFLKFLEMPTTDTQGSSSAASLTGGSQQGASNHSFLQYEANTAVLGSTSHVTSAASVADLNPMPMSLEWSASNPEPAVSTTVNESQLSAPENFNFSSWIMEANEGRTENNSAGSDLSGILDPASLLMGPTDLSNPRAQQLAWNGDSNAPATQGGTEASPIVSVSAVQAPNMETVDTALLPPTTLSTLGYPTSINETTANLTDTTRDSNMAWLNNFDMANNVPNDSPETVVDHFLMPETPLDQIMGTQDDGGLFEPSANDIFYFSGAQRSTANQHQNSMPPNGLKHSVERPNTSGREEQRQRV